MMSQHTNCSANYRASFLQRYNPHPEDLQTAKQFLCELEFPLPIQDKAKHPHRNLYKIVLAAGCMINEQTYLYKEGNSDLHKP